MSSFLKTDIPATSTSTPTLYDTPPIMQDEERQAEPLPEKANSVHSASKFSIQSILQKLGAETRGIEWVPPEEREKKNLWDNFLLWFSVNIAVTIAPVGTLAGVTLGLGTRDALLTIFFFNAFACATVGFLATLGPATGLRQMIITRFSFGWSAAIFISLLNVITQLGYSVISVLVGGQTLCAVWTSLPGTWGIIITSALTVLVCFFGYKAVHVYERYSWIGVLIIFCLMYGSGKGNYTVTESTVEGQDLIASVLILGGVVFGTAAGWGPIASDYNMTLPESTSRTTVFSMTFFGNFLALCLIESLGVVMTSAFATNTAWSDAYTLSWGNLMSESLSIYGDGWRIFFMIVLASSAVTVNIPTTYSMALSIQALHPTLAAVPRAIWVLVGAIAYTIAAVIGQNSFFSFFQNFMAVLSYWVALYVIVLFEEHFLFRGGVYNASEYNDASKLPVGWAGWSATAVAAVAAVLGMSQVWYEGVVAKAIGGGDLGFELVMLFSGVVYPVVRYFELRHYGR
ncbi:hypothetical protein HDU98_002866 [Podochytrium sp. JEL0797]|nr:hypothetical protein HDU98_002866 [Podochytrium sp. JEL0797]